MIWFMSVALAGTAAPCSDSAQMAQDNARLRELFNEDAEDRASRSPNVYKNDIKRAKELVGMQEAGRICTALDQYLAAATLQHSQEPDQIKVAYDMALAAMNGHAENSAWLVAQIFDRYKVARGLAQWYGTQFSIRDGKKCIFEVDPTATDDERKLHGIASITETYTTFLAESGKAGYEPTTEILVRYNLQCESKAWR